MSMVAEPVDQIAPPSGGVISELGSIWKTVLGVDAVNPDDEFFDNGGNSMLLLVMIEKIQESLSVEIELDELAEGISLNILSKILEEN